MAQPPLNAVRTFVLAARHRSFTAAAKVSSVTQGAVSQQISRFEDYLGVSLFERRRGGLELTLEGRRLFLAVAEHIDRIDQATRAARIDPREEKLAITTLNSFASQWLMPRLPEFQRRHPEVRLRLETTLVLLDLLAGEADAAIRHGHGEWPGLTAERLMLEELFPVATPAFADTLDLEHGPEALKAAPLYYDLDGASEWADWFVASGCTAEGLELSHGFTDSMVMLRALLSGGDGVALLRSSLVESELADGSMVRLFETSTQPAGGYWLVYPSGRLNQPAFAAFRDWLLDAVAAYEADRSTRL